MIGQRSRQSEQLLTDMKSLLDRIDTALIVRDPGTALSAAAYEGLRKQVVASATARLQHMVQLAEFDVALRRGASTEDLLTLVDQWLRQAGVERVEDPTTPEVWETTLAPGVDAVVDVAAYVDGVANRVVRQGRLKATPVPPRQRANVIPDDEREASLPATPPVDQNNPAGPASPVVVADSVPVPVTVPDTVVGDPADVVVDPVQTAAGVDADATAAAVDADAVAAAVVVDVAETSKES